MNFKIEQYHRDTPDSDLIDDIKRVAGQLSKNSVTMSEYEQYGNYHPSTLKRRFGSWFKILEKADLEYSRPLLNNSEEDLFRNIEKMWIKLGRQPKYSEVKKPFSDFSAGTYEKRFGSWLSALEKFIIYINYNRDNELNNLDNNPPNVNNFEPDKKHKTKREISDRLRFKILMRDGFTCKSCGRSPIKDLSVELHVDHITPWSKGGETIPENLETKCKECNLGKGNAFKA